MVSRSSTEVGARALVYNFDQRWPPDFCSRFWPRLVALVQLQQSSGVQAYEISCHEPQTFETRDAASLPYHIRPPFDPVTFSSTLGASLALVSLIIVG